MDSEEMRTELERFVNTGLQEGWHGWPLKSAIGDPGLQRRSIALGRGSPTRLSTLGAPTPAGREIVRLGAPIIVTGWHKFYAVLSSLS
jgi:hypothetical protein